MTIVRVKRLGRWTGDRDGHQLEVIQIAGHIIGGGDWGCRRLPCEAEDKKDETLEAYKLKGLDLGGRQAHFE